ncbi:MAG: hypothetical protein ABI548_02805 [Polyangiaceae bacterium]
MGHSGFEFRLHQVAYSEVDANGFIGIQFDAFGEEKSGMPTVEAHHPFGFMSRPSDPEVDSNGAPQFGCNVLVGWEGEEAHAWVMADPRSRLVLPVLQKGETLFYGAAGNFFRCHADGRVSMFTTDDGTPNGKTVALQIKPDGLLFSAPWGKITFDATGFHVLHSSGAAIDLGAIGGLASPLDALGTYVKLTGAMVQLEASIIANGPAAGIADAPVKTLPLVTLLGTLEANIVAVQAALVAIGAGPAGVPPAVGTAVAAAGVTATAAGIAISGAALTLPSSSTAVT